MIIVHLLSLFIAAGQVADRDWTLVATANSGARWFIDTASIRDSTSWQGDAVKLAWIKEDASRDKRLKYRYELLLEEVDCRSQTIGVRDATTYNSNGGVLHVFHSQIVTAAAVTPETMGEAVFLRVCS